MKKSPDQNSKKEKNPSVSPVHEKRNTRYVWLYVLPDDLWLKVKRGTTVWEALQKARAEIEGECNGLGKCGKCTVKVLSTTTPPTSEESELLSEEELTQGIRLACRTIVNQDLVISIGESFTETEYSQILTTSHILNNGQISPSQIDPLVDRQLITLSPDTNNEGLSDLDRIKLALGPEYKDLKASLQCLRTLPQMLIKTQSHGTAVFHNHCLMAWQEQEKINNHCGLAFDIGTSTLVGKLINLVDGSEVAVASRLNSQSKHGTDVISRLHYVKEHPKGLDRLHRILIKDLNQITASLLKTAKLKPEDIFVAIAAGNTTMQHFLLSLPPYGIAEAPFSPVLSDGIVVKAADAGLQIHPTALLYTMPVKSGYVGGDMISVILTSGAAEQKEEIILGLDLGTNGEIFLGNRKRLLTCSAAAGPALEGARISDGMIARAGAIESVSFEKGDLHYLVVGNIKPKGICGSGLVELVALLLELGIIDNEGLIQPSQKKAAHGLNSRVINRSGVCDFLIASAEESYDNKPVYLTQRDVRELQLAKGAIAAGIKTLADEMGIGIEDIDHIYLAGALGNYVNPNSAMRTGLIPRVDPGIIRSLGNAASTGVSMVLLSRNHWQKSKDLTDFIEHIELSSRLDFNQHFIEQMDFPKENMLDIYREDLEDDIMRTIKVGDIMCLDYPTVPSTMAVEEMSNHLRNTGRHGFPVLDEKGRLFGIATLADLEHSLERGNPKLTVGDIATRKLLVAYADQSVSEILQGTTEDYGRIPVVDRNDKSRLVGVLRRHDIMTAYRTILAQIKKVTES